MSDGGCVSTGPCLDFELVGVSEAVTDGIEVYPNPAHDACTIRSPGAAIQRIILRDMSGKSVYHSGQLVKGDGYFLLSLDGIPAGIYTLSIMMSDQTLTVSKIAVE